MKHTLLAAVGFAALLAVPSVASAQTADSGWYLRGNLGYGAFTDTDLTGGIVGDIEAEGNAAGSLGLGYEFDNNWRVELDGSTMWNDMGSISQLPGTKASIRSNDLFLNAIYDFEDFGNWEPYVGAGVGFGRAKLSTEAHNFAAGLTAVTNAACNDDCRVKDNASSLGWKILAGLGYKINDNLTWDNHYSYTNYNDLGFQGTRLVLGNPDQTRKIQVNVEDLASHKIMTGLRYRFGPKAMPIKAVTPPPPPPPVDTRITCWDGSMAADYSLCPAEPEVVVEQEPTVVCYDGTLRFTQSECPLPPAPPVIIEQPVASICDQGAVPFVVYFEWDKSRLTDQAQAVIDQASTYTQQCGVDGVTVEGHTDTSGNAAYNVNLSSRRADVVANALVAQGVDAARISKQAMGEKGLAVQTDDNVREPLNRRSEVVIRLVPTNAF